MRYILDTHALLWHLTNDNRLGANARRVLDDEDARLVIPSIVLAEAKHIADRKRVRVAFNEILQAIVSSPRVMVFPLDIFAVAYLPENLDIHDGLIVATALLCRDLFEDQAAILTNDQAITESASIPVVW